MSKRNHVKGIVKGTGKDANKGLGKKSERPAPTMPLLQFVEGVAYWQCPTPEHVDVLRNHAEKCKWTIEEHGIVAKTGLMRYRIVHNWLRAQWEMEHAAELEERHQAELDRAAMHSLPHLVFKGNLCTFVPETDEQVRGVALKAERLGWEYEVLPDGVYRIAKVNRKATG